MSAAKHTSGPWTVAEGRDLKIETFITIKGADNHMIAGLVIGGFATKADAALIAGAPDLLDACEAALKRFDETIRGGRPSVPPLEYAALLRAAIAKARGGK